MATLGKAIRAVSFKFKRLFNLLISTYKFSDASLAGFNLIHWLKTNKDEARRNSLAFRRMGLVIDAISGKWLLMRRIVFLGQPNIKFAFRGGVFDESLEGCAG
jgi:hypothetical protein